MALDDVIILPDLEGFSFVGILLMLGVCIQALLVELNLPRRILPTSTSALGILPFFDSFLGIFYKPHDTKQFTIRVIHRLISPWRLSIK